MRQASLVFLYKRTEKKILLAMKKRGFGENKWNGVGGKLEDGESVEDSAIRESKEEILVDIDKSDLRNVAVIDFSFETKHEWNQRVIVFLVERWKGEPIETEEMKPRWFDLDQIPYSEMWIDDEHWLPLVLNGDKLEASFTFSDDGGQILDMKIDKW